MFRKEKLKLESKEVGIDVDDNIISEHELSEAKKTLESLSIGKSSIKSDFLPTIILPKVINKKRFNTLTITFFAVLTF